MKFEKYKVIETRLYVKKGEILVEKINKKHRHSYKRIIRSKTYPITQESHKARSQTYYNELASITEAPKKLEKKTEKIEEKEEYEEYEYFVGFDYETPKITSKDGTLYGTKGKHDFKTEFKVSSPIKLNNSELASLIQTKFKKYGVLENTESYEIKSNNENEPIKAKRKPSFEVKFTEKITR